MASNGSRISFDPAKDMPRLTGKVLLVTGGNVGLGKQACLEFARHNPAQIWLAARNLEKAKTAANEIEDKVPGAPIKILQLDLSSFDSVKQAARTFLAESDRLDILMLNAGVMAIPPGLTKDGYEVQFGTNHLGHALLTKLLLPVLEHTSEKANSDVRIVSLTSNGHRFGPTEGIRFDTLTTTAETMGAYGRYGQSKLSNILFARQLAKLYPKFTVSSIHPGLVDTTLMYRAEGLPWLLHAIGRFTHTFTPWIYNTPEQGVRNQIWASVAKGVSSGEYYEPVGVGEKVRPWGKDDKLAQKLWDWTEENLAAHVI